MFAKSSFFGPHLCIVDQRLRRSLSEEDMRHSLNADQIIVVVFFVCLDEPVVGNEIAVLAFFIDRRIRSSLPRRNLKLRIGVLLKEDAEKLLLIGTKGEKKVFRQQESNPESSTKDTTAPFDLWQLASSQ